MAKLYIIRGWPGSGKSTKARELLELGLVDEHYEADMYFTRNGEYNFDGKKLLNAHRWCFNEVFAALCDGKNVAVSNTFTSAKELNQYTTIGFDYEIITCSGDYQNVHEVPAEKVKQMKQRLLNTISKEQQ